MIVLKFLTMCVIMIFILCVASACSTHLENEMVVRYIDISTQLVIINSHIKVLNKHPDPTHNYVYTVDPDWIENLSFIEALDENKNTLTIESRNPKSSNLGKSKIEYNIFFPKPILFGETKAFIVSLVITNHLKSSPKSVKQNEKNMVLFSFNIYYHSMYVSHIQTTYLYMGTTKAAQIDGANYKIANDSEYGLKYGPFYEVEPFENTQSVFHYENNSPFLVAEKVKRYIKLSHWGYISVWDQIHLFHSGPKLQGSFERSFFNNKKSYFQDTKIERFDSTLPEDAFDIYLRDEIGLISSFQVSYDSVHGVTVSIQPRNILYGGWKTEYVIGYSLPISEFVTVQGNAYMLTFPLMDKIFENMIVKEIEVNIILPEGAAFVAIDPNFKIENRTESKYCYYFDVNCREIITFKGYNLVEKHIINMTISYTFSKFNLLIKPMAIAIGLYFILIFLKMIQIPRLELLDQNEEQVRPVKSTESLNSAEGTAKKTNKRKTKQKKL